MSQAADTRRTATERAIARRVIKDALAAGCKLSVHDGGDWAVKQSQEFKKVFGALFSTDGDTLVIRNAEGGRIGFVGFVYGNDGYDVISDHTDNEAMNALLAGANEISRKAEARL